MTGLTESEKRDIARIAAINVSKHKNVSLLVAIICFGAAFAEFAYACVNHDYSIDFIRTLLLITFGGGTFEQARLYVIIQKLAEQSQLKDEIGQFDMKTFRKRFWAILILMVVLGWLVKHFFAPSVTM